VSDGADGPQGWAGWRRLGAALPGVDYEYRRLTAETPPTDLDRYRSHRVLVAGTVTPAQFCRRFRPTRPLVWLPWAAVTTGLTLAWAFTLGLPVALLGLLWFAAVVAVEGVRSAVDPGWRS